MQVGDVAHLTPITNSSEEELAQLQQDLRMLNGKTLTPEWYMSESLGDRMKLLQLFQAGMSYLHYSNSCRKELLQDIVQENERKEKEVAAQLTQVKQRKKKIEHEREHLYDLKDEYHVKKESVKQYRAYLEKLHFCQKCKRPVRSVKEHDKKHHEKEPAKETQQKSDSSPSQ